MKLLFESVVLLASIQAPPQLESLMASYWGAVDSATRAEIGAELASSGIGFDELHAQLQRGRPYAQDVPRGKLLRERRAGGLRHPYMILVPEDYDPQRRWPMRLELHGGMGADEWTELDGAWSPDWRSAHGQIVIVPAGW